MGQPEAAGATAWAVENAKDRRLAMDFLKDRPLGYLNLLRLLNEPLRVYLASQFGRAADGFELGERSRLAKALIKGEQYSRQFRVVQVASGEDDKRLVKQLVILASSAELWEFAPPSFRTVRMRVFLSSVSPGWVAQLIDCWLANTKGPFG